MITRVSRLNIVRGKPATVARSTSVYSNMRSSRCGLLSGRALCADGAIAYVGGRRKAASRYFEEYNDLLTRLAPEGFAVRFHCFVASRASRGCHMTGSTQMGAQRFDHIRAGLCCVTWPSSCYRGWRPLSDLCLRQFGDRTGTEPMALPSLVLRSRTLCLSGASASRENSSATLNQASLSADAFIFAAISRASAARLRRFLDSSISSTRLGLLVF